MALHRRRTTASPPGERGAVAVEFALVLPLLVLLLFGIVEFGRGYNAKIELQGAVREGARTLAIGPTAGDVVGTTVAALPTLDTSKVAISTSGTPCTPGDVATVTATYPLDYTIPMFGTGTWTLRATGAMRCGG